MFTEKFHSKQWNDRRVVIPITTRVFPFPNKSAAHGRVETLIKCWFKLVVVANEAMVIPRIIIPIAKQIDIARTCGNPN